MDRDFILARAAATRARAEFITEALGGIIGTLAEPDDESSLKGFQEDTVDMVENLIDEAGLLSRGLELIQLACEQIDARDLKAGEPDYDEFLDDGADAEEAASDQ